jgi:hypothetical protein
MRYSALLWVLYYHYITFWMCCFNESDPYYSEEVHEKATEVLGQQIISIHERGVF